MSEATTDTPRPARAEAPRSFWVMAVITAVGTAIAIASGLEPHQRFQDMWWLTALMSLFGVYLVVGTTWAHDLLRDARPIRRSIDWFGEEVTWFCYRALGFLWVGGCAAMTVGALT